MPASVGVVVLVSEQVLPALTFLLHIGVRYSHRLRFIGLYHTADRYRSREPAQRLEAMLKRWRHDNQRNFKIDMHEGDGRPYTVRESLVKWFSEVSVAHWVVNATGGTKPMSAAAFEITRGAELASRRVLYLELSGQWFEWTEDDDGYLIDRPIETGSDPDVPGADTLDRCIPIDAVAQAQYALSGSTISQGNWYHIDDLRTTLAAVAREGWDWRRASLPDWQDVCNAGTAFENFVLNVLVRMGIQAVRSLQSWSDRNQQLAEMDIVALHKGRLFCLDLKLYQTPEDMARGGQLAKCATDTRQFFGSAASAIALRPGWSDKHSGPAVMQAKALGLTLMMQDSMRTLFSTLARKIDPTLVVPAEVMALEHDLLHHQGFSVISHLGIIDGRLDAGIYPLTEALGHAMRFRGLPWCLTRLYPNHFQLLVSKEDPPAWFGTHAPDWEQLGHRLVLLWAELGLAQGARRVHFDRAHDVWELRNTPNRVKGMHIEAALRAVRESLAGTGRADCDTPS